MRNYFVFVRLRVDNATVQLCGQQVFNFCSSMDAGSSSSSGGGGGGGGGNSRNFQQQTTQALASQVIHQSRYRRNI
jgi:hypothetical protein